MSVVLVPGLIAGACAIYLGDYYRADNEAIGAFLPQGTVWKEEPSHISLTQIEKQNLFCTYFLNLAERAWYKYKQSHRDCNNYGILRWNF